MTEHPQFGPNRTTANEPEAANMGGCLTRIAWLIAAPLTLLMLGAIIARDGDGARSSESIAYWAVVALALVVRYLDIFKYAGVTVNGEPASGKDWRRYRLSFPALAVAGWCLALVLGEV